MKCGFVSFIGRPNAGKSTLINALLHAPRVIVDAEAGTTRDPIDLPFVMVLTPEPELPVEVPVEPVPPLRPQPEIPPAPEPKVPPAPKPEKLKKAPVEVLPAPPSEPERPVE